MKHTIQTTLAGLPKASPECRIDVKRRWRFDYAWPALKVAWEIHGGVYSHGRHTRGGGFTADREKMNEAALAGWLVIETTTGQVESGQALAWLERAVSCQCLRITKEALGSSRQPPPPHSDILIRPPWIQ